MPENLLFDREANGKERLAFVRSYAAWVKRTPKSESGAGSRQNSLTVYYENAKNMPISATVYLERVAGRKRRVP